MIDYTYVAGLVGIDQTFVGLLVSRENVKKKKSFWLQAQTLEKYLVRLKFIFWHFSTPWSHWRFENQSHKIGQNDDKK